MSLQYIADGTFQTASLGSSYTAGGGSLVLTTGQGARFPSTGDFWVLVRDETTNPPSNEEIFKATARSTDTLTVTGAQNGTANVNHAAGEIVRWVMSVEALNQLKADILGQAGMVLLEEHTASASASLDFTTCITSTYDEYLIEFINVRPATDEANLYMRMSTDGGSSYDSGNNYGWANIAWRAGGSGINGAESGQAQITLVNSGVDNGASTSAGVTGSIRLVNPASAAFFKQVFGKLYAFGATFHIGYELIGSYQSATAVNAFQFLFSAGNVTSGTIRVYGITKS